MEYLLIDEDGSPTMLKGRELNDDEMQMISDGTLMVYRYHGNTFEIAVAEEMEEENFEVIWEPIKVTL